MSKKMKIEKPKISSKLIESTDIIEKILDYETVEDSLIEDTEIQDINNIIVKFNGCIFRNVVFENCDFRKIDMVDVVFENCDLSNIDFSEGSIYRTEFTNCKMIGSKIEDCHLKDCIFKNVLGDYSSFAFSKLNRVSFEGSSFVSSVFMEVKNKHMDFDDCNFKKTVFTRTYLEDVNLSNCEIDGIEIGIPELYKAKVNAIQGLELVKLMGLIVE